MWWVVLNYCSHGTLGTWKASYSAVITFTVQCFISQVYCFTVAC